MEANILHRTKTEAEELELQERGNLQRIATDLRARTFTGDDPRLDPENSEFDPYRWAETALSKLDREGITAQEQGIAFSNLRVSGSGSTLQFQETVLSSLVVPFRHLIHSIIGKTNVGRRRILHGFEGLLQSGELLLVLGRPGSGCSTFLKTICGHLEGLHLEPESIIQFRGISFEAMIQHYRGEVAYNQEIDEHFPHLTVAETLSFAASSRVPQNRLSGLSRSQYVQSMVKVVMAIFGLSHTFNTKVGDNFVRGVSGGERKRVSIAEMFLSRARIGAWDNSTRGLDAASALQFIKSLRLSADLGKSCHAVAAYQASQPMYDLFDKVAVLYNGREIFFGSRQRAIEFFEEMGWYRNPARVDADFLTALTNPGERSARVGMEEKVPRTPDDFEKYWKQSKDYQALVSQIDEYRSKHPIGGKDAEDFHQGHMDQQARHSRQSSPYLLSVPMQIRLCLQRAVQRMRNDLPTVMSTVVAQIALSLIIGSIFFNSPNSSSAFFQKGAVLFFAILMNALITINEIMQLYSQRPVVEKQARYAFVHPFAEAIASALSDLPIKVMRCSVFSVVLYFMTNLYREPGEFFIFYLFLVTAILTMSSIFRSLAAITRSIGQAMGMAGIMVLCIIVYTGFTLPQSSMHPWFSWIRWINPIYYAFEALISNEFHGRNFECASFVPPYGVGNSTVCASIGAIPGQKYVQGDEYIWNNYHYSHLHLWRNYGILVAFMIAFHVVYFAASEFCTFGQSKAESLVFRPGHAPTDLPGDDVECQAKTIASDISPSDEGMMNLLPKQKDILIWRNVTYDIPVKEGTRRLLDGVHGWVKPGTLTALMGVSGAGKTTLLDVLAQRTSIGVVSGDILVNGKSPGVGFPRRTGYVQQQDLHLETTTVREALQFSAVLRQPPSVAKVEKLQYVEGVIRLLGMEDFAEAVVGRLGEGLNVEQRKLLSIGVELAARPTLLIFLDEPTSGLDSQSSWTICALLRRLADNGQAVLATIHQPSALLFQSFDRLLFMAQGGKTVYFGDIGSQSSILLNYFYRNGARKCEASENPAEYILRMVSGDEVNINWVSRWNESPELREVFTELGRLEDLKDSDDMEAVADNDGDFALSMRSQFRYVAVRAFQQYFRQPEYIFSKFALGIASGLFIGFSFWDVDYSQQGFQNALFSIFLMCSIFSTLVNQIMPKFVLQRSLYEVRERPSRVYSWQVFILSQMLVEVPWQALLGVCAWASAYFPVFGGQGSSESQGLVMLFIVQFYIYAASMAQMVVAALDDPAMGAQIATLMFGLCFVFNGVMQPPDALPGFWIFMYHLSPFTYYVAGIASAALGGRPVQCSSTEISVVDPPAGQTCGEYLGKFLEVAGGRLYNEGATSACEYCTMSSADEYLAQRRIDISQRWRNYGIFVSYFVFNAFFTIVLYYFFRVRGWKSKKA